MATDTPAAPEMASAELPAAPQDRDAQGGHVGLAETPERATAGAAPEEAEDAENHAPNLEVLGSTGKRGAGLAGAGTVLKAPFQSTGAATTSKGRIVVAAPRDLAEKRMELSEMLAERSRNLEATVSRHKAFLRQVTEEIRELEKTKTELTAQMEKLESALMVEKTKEDAILADINLLKDQLGSIPARLEELRRQEDEERAALHKLQSELEKHGDDNDRTNADLTQGLIAFKRNLGLDFERVGDDQLMLKFVNIDPANHLREFFFSILIDADGTYHLTSCVPPISEQQTYLNELNRTNDFSKFVRRMRQQFRAMVV